MTPGLIFLAQALVVVALPVVLLRFSKLKGLVPLVVVQILVGIALGPSLFGRFAPEAYHLFFNNTALSALSGIGAIAVLTFGLITGLHLDPSIFRHNGRAPMVVALASIVVPTALGCIAGFWIVARHPQELAPNVSSSAFAAAIGISTGVTALPVLGAILREMDLLGREIGHLALAVAGLNDVALWIVLGVLLTAVMGNPAEGSATVIRIACVPVYLGVMLYVVRPLLGQMVVSRMRGGEVQERALAVVAGVTIASALTTEALGLHYIIGAFVTGAIIPENLRKPILDRLQVMTVALLMPFFFMLTGLRTLIDPGSSAFLEIFAVATVVAVIGKVGGSAIAARLVGHSWPTALALGGLLQTKGLMEVIVLAILLDAGIISANVFAALILMAVVSTALAMPGARLMLARESEALGGRIEPLVSAGRADGS